MESSWDHLKSYGVDLLRSKNMTMLDRKAEAREKVVDLAEKAAKEFLAES